MNSDQYLWKVTIDEMNAAEQTDVGLAWDSLQDFSQSSTATIEWMGAIGANTIVLNEFMFVD
ncbi:MAG: hypothetical protein R3C56_32825 [Pirellulaceae bacterium]